MKFSWLKMGLIFKPDSVSWMKSHSMLPTAECFSENVYKIYFAPRNNLNQSLIGYFVINLDTLKILEVSQDPVLTPGKLGTFDDNGVLPSSVININGSKYMYYIGFKPGGTTRMDLFGGLSIFKGENELVRCTEAPIIERCKVNPYINTAPFVIKTRENNTAKYFMYYVAGCGWIHKDLPKYNIQIAFSNDGIGWKRDGTICIDFKDDDEVALARPYVLWYSGKYHMWFSYKGEAYRIGYAVSNNGIDWLRCDEVGGMDNSKQEGDFDSEMVSYACVVPHNDKLFMFYNGNNYGVEGIGLAVSQ
jgi:hypothetical protein